MRRVWLVTTNDNLAALRFYQRRGFALAALHPRAIEVSRRLKPSIPPVGHDGIVCPDGCMVRPGMNDACPLTGQRHGVGQGR